MQDAKQRLIVALDVSDGELAIQWVERLAPYVGVFKVGLELFIGQGPQIISRLKAAGAPAIFLDLKLHDIPATMQAAARVAAGLEVDMLTCHCEQAAIFNDIDLGKTRLLGVTVLTSLGVEDLQRQGYVGALHEPANLALVRARLAQLAGCHGVVCSGHEARAMRELLGPDALVVCPGIRPAQGELNDQKRVMTPAQAMAAGASHIVVGRPILQAGNPMEAALAIVREMAEN